MTKVEIGQSPVIHVEDLALVDGKKSFSHSISHINRVTFDVQHKDGRIPIPYAFEDNGGAFTDESSDARNTTDNDVNLLPATPAVDDAFYFGANEPFKRVIMQDGTDGVGTWTIVWEYWDGDGWTSITPIGASTDFTDVSDEIYWVMPTDWERYIVNSTYAYWMRARVSVYSAITTRPQAKSIALEINGKEEWAPSEQLLESFQTLGDTVLSTTEHMLSNKAVPIVELFTDGNIAAIADTVAFDAPFDGEITRCDFSMLTTGSTGDNVGDVFINGTTIYTSGTGRPTINNSISDGTMTSFTNVSAGSFSAGDRITIDIITATTGTVGTDPKFTVYAKYKPFQAGDGRITRVDMKAATVGTGSLTSIQYCRVYDDSAAAFVDEDAAAKESTDNDVELHVSPTTAGDMVNYGCDVPFYSITHVGGTDAVHSLTVTWQYYNGSAWTTLTTSAVSQDYSDVSDPIYFEPPGDWAVNTVDTVSAYWIRSNVTAFTSVTTEPQAGSVTLGVNAVVDVNVAGTTIYTVQGGRAVLHDETNDGIIEINGGRVDAQGLPSSAGIVDGHFTEDQEITVQIDYAAPSTGVEPVDLEVFVYGVLDESKHIEKMSWKSPVGGKYLSIWSDNLKSTTKIRVIIEGW